MLSLDQFGFNAFWWGRLWTEEELRSCFSTLASIGYKKVELKWDSFNPGEPMAAQLVRAQRVAAEEGLLISNFVILRDVINPAVREQGIKDVTAYMRAVAETDVSVLNLVCGGVPRGMPVASAWENVLSAFEEYVRVAEECRVTLAFESVVGQLIDDYFTTVEFLRHFDSEYLGLTLDPSHYQLRRNCIPWAIRQWGDRIKHVHVKDAVGVPGEFGVDFLFPILGEGAIDFNEFFGALEDIGYGGALSVEFESFKYYDLVMTDVPREAAEVSWRSIERIWSRFRDSRPGA